MVLELTFFVLAQTKQLCQLEPRADSGWHYRTKVNGRPEKCWYEGERMKPRNELYWAETPAIPQMLIVSPPEAEPGEFELRWKGRPHD